MAEWPVWLVISKRMATLQELETWWTLDDLMRAVDFILARQDMETAAMKK